MSNWYYCRSYSSYPQISTGNVFSFFLFFFSFFRFLFWYYLIYEQNMRTDNYLIFIDTFQYSWQFHRKVCFLLLLWTFKNWKALEIKNLGSIVEPITFYFLFYLRSCFLFKTRFQIFNKIFFGVKRIFVAFFKLCDFFQNNNLSRYEKTRKKCMPIKKYHYYFILLSFKIGLGNLKKTPYSLFVNYTSSPRHRLCVKYDVFFFSRRCGLSILNK